MTQWLGSTWLATEDGLYKWVNGAFKQEVEHPLIQEISSDGRSLWFRSGSGIHYVTPTDVTEYGTPSPPTAVAPSGLTGVGTEDQVGAGWVGEDELLEW